MFFHKKNRYELDMTTANNALQNILSSCNQPVNTIPFDKLVLRKKVNAASYNRLIVATTLIFVLTFLSPLAIVPLSEMTEKLLFLHKSFHHFCFHTSTHSLYSFIHRYYKCCGSNSKVWKQNLLPHLQPALNIDNTPMSIFY